MKVLIACEESQTVCKAFRALGHEAYSCDILDCSGGHPEWHIKGDALEVLTSQEFDLKIGFPPCDHLAVSGARWFTEKRADGRQRRGIQFFLKMANLCDAIENPIGIMSGGSYFKKHYPEWAMHTRKPDQIIQPWQFGHGETKATCLWLKGLPLLQPTNIVDGRESRIHKMPPTPDRAKLRSKTYEGIAAAMAQQWGGVL
jgi:hypothetical protein